jgi:hypothetical protein
MEQFEVETRIDAFFAVGCRWRKLESFLSLETARQYVIAYKASHPREKIRIIKVIQSEYNQP